MSKRRSLSELFVLLGGFVALVALAVAAFSLLGLGASLFVDAVLALPR